MIGKRLVERRRGLSATALAVANREVRSAYSPIVITGVMRLIDFGLISLSGVALSLYWTAAVGDSWRCLFLAFGIAAAAVVIFQFLEIYHVLQFRILRLSRMTLGLFIAVLLAMGGSHFIGFHDATLQSWFAAFFCTGVVALISERIVLRAVLRKWGKEGRLDRRTIIVGADRYGERLITALKAQEGSNVDILGVFDDRGDGRAQEICAGVSKLGKVDDILEFAYRTRVDLILFALPISAEKRILQMLKKLWVLPVDIHLSAHTSELRFRPRYYSNLAQTPTPPMFEKPITDWDMVMKWAFDRVVGMLLLVIAAPLMTIVALAIKLDSKGPSSFASSDLGLITNRSASSNSAHCIMTALILVRRRLSPRTIPALLGSEGSFARLVSMNCRSF